MWYEYKIFVKHTFSKIKESECVMSKANKWLAVLCASASAISTVSAYNLFFSSNTADQIRHETANQEPPNKPCELENTNADEIIPDSFRPQCHPGVGPSDPPPTPRRGGSRGIFLHSIKKNIDIYRKKSQKLQVENIIKDKPEPNDSDKKVTMPDISDPSLKMNNDIFEQQPKDFVSCMNEHFTISGKKVRKEYAKSVASRLEFVSHSKKDSSSQHIKDFSQQFNSLFPDSETKDFVAMIGGTSFQKVSVDNHVINSTVSERGEEKSNYQKIREINEQFNALSKDLTQIHTYDTININILKKQKLQESYYETSKSDKEKSNNQKLRELRNQLSENACESNGDSDSLSTDDRVLKHSNYSFDDDNISSNSMFNMETDDVDLTIFKHNLKSK